MFHRFTEGFAGVEFENSLSEAFTHRVPVKQTDSEVTKTPRHLSQGGGQRANSAAED